MNGMIRWRPAQDLIPRNFFRKFWDSDFEEVLERMMKSEAWKKFDWTPKVETYSKNGNYVIKADLPGVEAKDIHVELEEGFLTIRGERKMDKEVKEKKGHGREVFYGTFERTLSVPSHLKAEEVKAKYQGGVLEITLPIDEKSLPRKIKVEHVTH